MEEIKWEEEFRNIPNPNSLNLPTYDEFMANYLDYEINIKSGILRLATVNDKIGVYLYANSKEAYRFYGPECLFIQPLNKENYIKACYKFKEVFLNK